MIQTITRPGKKILCVHDGLHQSVDQSVMESLQLRGCSGVQLQEASLVSGVQPLLDTLVHDRPDAVLVVGTIDDPAAFQSFIDGVTRQNTGVPILVSSECLDGCTRYTGIHQIRPVAPGRLVEELRSVLKEMDGGRDPLPPLGVLREQIGLRQLIGNSPEFLAEVRKIPAIARFDVTVMMTGETGTGKEVFSRAVHYLSRRSNGPFVPVNCGAIPTDLIENELFGHDQGAFTSATSSKKGLVQEANGGTLFLDEIDCLSPLAQVKLLRFLQDNEYRHLGSPKLHRSDVRVIAATNVDVVAALRSGRLRQDLFYRLDIIRLHLPPLRQRGEDVLLLARHFLSKYAAAFGRDITNFSDDAARQLLLHDWPGNVRELENTVQRAVILAQEPVIQLSDLILCGSNNGNESPRSFNEMKREIVSKFERSYIRDVLSAARGNVTRAAQAAKKNRRAFLELMRKHGIDKASVAGVVPFLVDCLADVIP